MVREAYDGEYFVVSCLWIDEGVEIFSCKINWMAFQVFVLGKSILSPFKIMISQKVPGLIKIRTWNFLVISFVR